MIRVGVFGAAGRMGQEVCKAVLGAPDADLVAVVDRFGEGEPLRSLGIDSDLALGSDRQALLDANAEVVVDFTRLDAARENLAWLAENGIHAVVGTTGFTDDDIASLRSAFTASNCLVAPNFSISAVLMMRFAELAAPHFDSVEVIELHHDGKIDAPSGTAMMTVERIAEASSEWTTDPTENEVVAGARGGKGPANIPVHAIRMRGLEAHQEVLFGATGQLLTIRQDAFDRSSYMPGVLLGIREVAERSGLTEGLDSLLGI